jgi:hypothetical protein
VVGGDRFGRVRPDGRNIVVVILHLLMSFVPSLFRSSLWSLALAFAIVRFFTGAGEVASYPNAPK